MKFTLFLSLLICFTFAHPMETPEQPNNSPSSYRFLLSDLLEKPWPNLQEEFPCEPQIPELIRRNLTIIPGWVSGNEFDWLREYKVRKCGPTHIIGAAIIRKCAQDLGLNLVAGPARSLAFVFDQEEVDRQVSDFKKKTKALYGREITCNEDECLCVNCYCLRIEKGKFREKATHDYILDKKIPTIIKPLSLAQVQQLCILFNFTGYKINHGDDVLHGTDGKVYLTDTCFTSFSQAKDTLRFEFDVYGAMNRLKDRVSLEPLAQDWLGQQIAVKFEELKARGLWPRTTEPNVDPK